MTTRDSRLNMFLGIGSWHLGMSFGLDSRACAGGMLTGTTGDGRGGIRMFHQDLLSVLVTGEEERPCWAVWSRNGDEIWVLNWRRGGNVKIWSFVYLLHWPTYFSGRCCGCQPPSKCLLELEARIKSRVGRRKIRREDLHNPLEMGQVGRWGCSRCSVTELGWDSAIEFRGEEEEVKIWI